MNTLQHPKVPATVGELGVTADGVTTLVGGIVTSLSDSTSPSKVEAEQLFVPMEHLPLTRVGDNSYLPLDVKADFKGAIQPWAEVPYFLREQDNTLVCLRPGYNGEYNRVFYGFSDSGNLSVADVRLTDSEYRPMWLAATEYVTSIVGSGRSGFVAHIRSTSNLTLSRYFWIEHNGTLDSRFHTYADITKMMLTSQDGLVAPATYGDCQFIKEINAFIVLHTNLNSRYALTIHPLPNGFTFSSTYSSAEGPNFSAKSVTWRDWSGTVNNTGAVANVFDASTPAKASTYFTFLNEPAGTPGRNYIHSSSGRRQMLIAVKNGQLMVGVHSFMYASYTGTARQLTWWMAMVYDFAGNSWTPVSYADDPYNFQSMPLTVDMNATAPDTSSATAKTNKRPIDFNRSRAGYLFGNYVNRQFLIGTNMVFVACGTSQASAFAGGSASYADRPGNTLVEKQWEVVRKFDFNMDFDVSWYSATDAAILSKQLRLGIFTGDRKITINSDSQLYGESLTTKQIDVVLPDLSETNTVYSVTNNLFMKSLPSPNEVRLSKNPYIKNALTSTIRGDGPLAIHSMWFARLRDQSGVQPAVYMNIDPNTDVPSTTYTVNCSDLRVFASNIATQLVNAATLPLPRTDWTYTMSLIAVQGSVAYMLFSLNLFNGTQFQHHYATLGLTIVGGQIQIPSAASSAIISTLVGRTVGGNTNGSAYTAEAEALGVYVHTNGKVYVFQNEASYNGLVGGNSFECNVFRLSSTFQFEARNTWGNAPSWYALGVGVHPTYGFYWTYSWVDSQAKSLLQYIDRRSTASQSERLAACAEAWLAGAGQTSIVLVSSKSAAGFMMYTSTFPVFMNGKRGVIPTQSFLLSDFTQNPANKTFFFYVQDTDDGFKMVASLTTIPESATSTYLGTVVTNSTGILSSTLDKVTRIDNYRISGQDPQIGSSIRM